MKRIFQRWTSLLQRFINVDRDQRCWSAMHNRFSTVIVDNADQRSSNGFSKNYNRCHRFSTMIIVQRSSTMLQQRSLFPVNASSTLRQRRWPEPIINVDRCIDQIAYQRCSWVTISQRGISVDKRHVVSALINGHGKKLSSHKKVSEIFRFSWIRIYNRLSALIIVDHRCSYIIIDDHRW